VLPRIATPATAHIVTDMSTRLPVQRVEATFVGTPPVSQIERASGVSDVKRHGRIVCCLVAGSIQPFLEALRGHEVLTLQSTLAIAACPRLDGDNR
jgi:hypothetical protein